MCCLKLGTSLLIACVLLFNAKSIQVDPKFKIKLQNLTYLSNYARIRDIPKSSPNEENSFRVNDDITRNPCKRECIANQPMTCYYYMVVHHDETLGTECDKFLKKAIRLDKKTEEYALTYSARLQDAENTCHFADGVPNDLLLVNGQFPGQAIELCEGDTIVADVINTMHETTTIHWHGIHQIKTPHMDGVPHITQYPIMPGQAFRYRFEVDHAGTNWWHSHTDHQRAYGLAGPLIVRQATEKNVHAHRYDFDLIEHTLMLQDWIWNKDDTAPKNILINGFGRNVQKKSVDGSQSQTLYSSFDVVQGARYRFRAIFNGVSNCPISLSVDNHDLVVIASDGNDIEPIVVQQIVFHGAERFDFVLHANQPVDNYWIRIKGYRFCGTDNLHQQAILYYKGANRQTKPTAIVSYAYEPAGTTLNPDEEQGMERSNRIRIVDTNALQLRVEPPLIPFRTFYTSLSVVYKRNEFFFQIDDISFENPLVSLLQTRNLGIGGMFCNRTSLLARGQNCGVTNCACLNVIQVPAFKYVEFVITSTSETPHPVHLHGFSFRVVGMGVLGKEEINRIEEIDRKTPLPRRKSGAPLKDSVQVPGFGYTIIRFNTNNPGYWMFHCHISSHSARGMSAVIKVGDDAQMKLCPVSNCGLCGSVL